MFRFDPTDPFEKIKEILVMFDRNPLRGLLTEFRDWWLYLLINWFNTYSTKNKLN